MRPVHGSRVRGWLGASAFSALVAAHALTYFLAAPDHHDRARLLHDTGHGSWTSTFILAGAALVAGLIVFAGRWASPADRDAPPRKLFAYASKRLVPMQIVGFLGLEGAERALDHASALSILSEPLILLGVVLQIVVAAGCALLLVAFTRLVRKLRGARARVSESARLSVGERRAPYIPRSVARLAWNLRGPPPLLRSR